MSVHEIQTKLDTSPSWGAQIQAYEHGKRHVVHPELLRGPQTRVTLGQTKYSERLYDPVLQRFRDGKTEAKSRVCEETHRVAHLNRARDIQILREQPFDIIRHDSKLGPMASESDPGHGRAIAGHSYPDTAVDYNLISNLPLETHHWASPEQRPRALEKKGCPRLVPAHTVKDFNIVTNRYLKDHATKSKWDRRAEVLEATQKDAEVNSYNPLTQQFNDPRREEAVRTCMDAQDMERHLRAKHQQPPSFKGRETAFYDMVSNQPHDRQMLRVHDEAAANRTERYQNRYIMERNWHAQDVKGDHIKNVRALNRCAPARFEETTRKGYDIVTNKKYGNGYKEQTLYCPWTTSQPEVWQRAISKPRSRGASYSQMSSTAPGKFFDSDGTRSEGGRSRRPHSAHSRVKH